jgi:predicted glutamine amidotransferase
MCELLGMNCNVPTDIVFSFRGFRQRGGATGPHADGWGIAFYERRGCRLFHDPAPSAHSPMAHFLQSFPIKSKNVIAHIRKARAGGVCVENTHPFHRELWGRTWVFAHNGLLRGIKRRSLNGFRPIGTTDSEHAFCHMLNVIRRDFREPPPLGRLRRLIERLAADLAAYGEFNFLLSDSRALFAYCCTKLVYIQRRAPFSRAALADDDLEVDFSTVTTPNDRVVVVATAPLTRNEQWHPIAPGTLAVFTEGQRRGR